MAETVVSQLTSNVKTQDNPIKIDWLNEQTPVVSSVDVAQHFGRKHQHVLRDINKLYSNLPESFSQSNFGRAKYTDEQGKSRPAYNLTRDGFALLVMGFTGKAALKWKLRYIEAFNSLEKAVLENSIELAREAGFETARKELKSETHWLDGHCAGWHEGVKHQKRLDRLEMAGKAARYLQLGLAKAETARLLGISVDSLARLVKRAKAVGGAL